MAVTLSTSAIPLAAPSGRRIAKLNGTASGTTLALTGAGAPMLALSGDHTVGWTVTTSGTPTSAVGTIAASLTVNGAPALPMTFYVFDPALVGATPSALITNSFGMNFNIGSNAQVAPLFNNMAKQGRWTIGGTSTPINTAANLNAQGDIILMPAGGADIYIGRPGPDASYRVNVLWDGVGTLGPQAGPTTLESQTAGSAFLNITYPASPQLGRITSIRFAYTAASNPISNLRIYVVDGAGNRINTGTFDPVYMAGVAKSGVVRYLYAHGSAQQNNVDWCGPLDWADRSLPTASTVPSTSYANAKHTYGAGTSQLLFNALRGAGVGVNYYYSSIVFNSGQDIAKSLSELGMRNACGAAGNLISLTINPPSGAGLITRTLVVDDINFEVTPPAGCTTATNLANFMNRNQMLKALIYTQASNAAASVSNNPATFWLDKVRLTFTAQPIAASTITIAGTVYTFVASGAAGTQVNIGATLFATLTNLGAIINAQGNSYHEVILDATAVATRIDIFTYIGDATNVVLGGTTNATVGALPTGTGAFAPLAKTYLSGGTNPINRGGISVETHAQVCAEGNAAPWYIFPPSATDNFVEQCGIYWRDHPGLQNQKITFALGNEIWNFRFEYFEDLTFFAGLGILYNGGDPNDTNNLLGNATLGYAWKFKQVMTILKTVFAAQPERLIRMGEGIVVGSVTMATTLLRRPAAGGNAATCIADHVDHMACAPYYGSFGPSQQRNQYVAGAVYVANQYLWNKAATSGFGTDGAYFVPANFTATTLENDISLGRLVPFTPTGAYDFMLRSVFTHIQIAKNTADYIQAQVNDRGEFIKKSNYEAGQSNKITSTVDAAFFSPFVQAFYRDPGYLRLESIYLHGMCGATGLAQQKGFLMQFTWPQTSADGGRWQADGVNWGSQETIWALPAVSPRAEALYAAREGRFTAYWPLTTFPDPYNTAVNITLTGHLPTITGVPEVGGNLRLNLPTAGFAATQTAQFTLDGVATGAPVNVTGLTFLDRTCVAGDVGKVPNYVVTRTSSAGMGPDAVHTTTYAATISTATAFDADSTALIARMTVAPTSEQQYFINTFIVGMKSTSFLNAASQTIWTAMGRINIHWSHDRQAALLNWKGNTLAPTDNGMPFVAYSGFVSDGDTVKQFQYPGGVSVVPGWAQNDATNYAWLSVPSGASTQHGYRNPGTNGGDRLVLRNSDGAYAGVNGGAVNSLINPGATGAWFGGVRDPASVGFVKTYLRGALIQTVASTSIAPSTANGTLFHDSIVGAWAGGRIQGANLTTAQIAEFVRLADEFVANYLP